MNDSTPSVQTIPTAERELVECPRCADFAEGIRISAGEHKFQFVRPSEMIGGICPACFNQISKRHRAAVKGEVETPADMGTRDHHPGYGSDDHVAFEEDVGRVEICDFNHAEVEEMLGEIEAHPEDVRAQAAVLVSRIFVWTWKPGSGSLPGGGCSLKTALIRFGALFSGLRPDLASDRTYQSLAEEVGCTKQAVSRAALNFQDSLGIHFARSRSDSGRRRMATVRTGGPNRNTNGHNAPPSYESYHAVSTPT